MQLEPTSTESEPEIQHVINESFLLLLAQRKQMKKLIKRAVLIGMPLVIILWILIAITSGTVFAKVLVGLFNIAVFFLVASPAAIFMMFVVATQTKVRGDFMRQFAERNGCTFLVSNERALREGSLFMQSAQQGMMVLTKPRELDRNIVLGVYDGLPFELFHFLFAPANSHNKIEATVLELTFPGEVPPFFLSRLSDAFAGVVFHRKGYQRVALEGSMDQYYHLYAPAYFEIEALEVFSEDIQDFLGSHVLLRMSIEGVGNKIFIYQDRYIDTKQELDTFFELAQRLIDRLSARVQRMQDDVAAMRERTRKI